MRRRRTGVVACAVLCATLSCTTTSPDEPDPSPVSPVDDEPVDVDALPGRIVVTGDEALHTANADGTDVQRLAEPTGGVLDAAWSPDGERIVYRDSNRGFNVDDEIYAVDADGTGATNLTDDPANDWGPDWSPDGRTIVFNSDREGLPMGGYLMNPDGSDVRRIPIDVWIEYPAWSPDGERIAFMSARGTEYDIWAVDVDGSDLVQLTDSPGQDGWPAWSPDGERIAFSSVRDDCGRSDAPDCRSTNTREDDPHRDIWIVDADGGEATRVTAEFGQFVAWSPDGEHLLVWGTSLYVVRPDGTGRTRIPGIRTAAFPDWIG